NVQLTASDVKNAGKDGRTEITAGRNLTLDTLSTHRTEQGDWGKENYRHLTQQQDIGSQITGAGDVTLQAGQDLTATAAHVNAGQQLTAQAGNNLTLTTGTASSDLVEHSKQTSKGWLSKSSVETHDEVHDRQALSTTFSGDKVNLQAGKDLHISGSHVAGTQDVSLSAGQQLTVTTAAEAHNETHLRQEKKSGLMGTGGIGFTVGKASQKVTTDSDSQLNQGSTVGSSQGNVTLNAGEQLRVHGSEVIAGKDLTLTGQQVAVTSAENRHHTTTKTEQKQSGLTVALSGAAGGAVNSAVQTARTARNENDPRVKALQNTKAALSGVQAVQAGRLAEAQGSDDKGNNTLAGVSLSYGRQSSRSEQQYRQTTQQGSHLTAGDNLTITAHGDDKGTSGPNGDIHIQGSQLQAGKDLKLNANRDITLSSSQNTEQTTGKNSSHGSSLGVGLTAGPGGTGLNVSANVSRGNGRENGNGVSHHNTTLDAGQTITLNSGRDTTLKGAQVSGEQITTTVKRNLALSSEQDSNRYDSQQHNASAGVSTTVGPLTNGTASLSASRNKLHSNYDSVQEQTGLFAGKGGYQVNVGDHTQLDGAVIASQADKAKNTLNTGTLGFKDIQNKADFTVEQQSAGVSLGQPTTGQVLNNLAVNALTGSNNQGHDSSITHAAVSDGNLIIRDKAHQTQDIANLSRDTDNAANVLSPIFDKEKEQQRLKQAQLIGELSAQMTEIAGTEGKIIATQAAKAKLNHISEQDQADAKEKLINAGNQHPTLEDINKQIYDTAYTQALNDSGLGTGGKYQKALQAATAAIQGLAGNNLGQALAGGASPYLAGVIKELTTDPQTHQVDIATNTLAHAILGAVAAEVSGNNALSGAAGATSGELAAQVLIKQLYGDGAKVSELTEEQKQTISTLSTLAAGLAGGIAGDSTGSAVTGAQAGKNAADNNALSMGRLFGSEGAKHFEGAGSLAQKMAQSGATPEEINAALTHYLKGQVPDGQDPAKGLIIAWGNFFGVPLDVVLSNEQMTPQKAAEIVAGGIPNSEAKLIQFAAAKAYLSLSKYQSTEVVNGNGDLLAEHVKGNVIASQKSNKSSNFGKFSKAEGTVQESLGIWPPNRGAYGPVEKVTLPAGTIVDRYGHPGGNFVSPVGVPFENRALPPSYETTKPYFQYKVVKPIPDVPKSNILPWFGQKGKGTQYELPKSVQWYLDNEYIQKVNNK
ncbi:hemagglutinin repeat-containing protein, partial [Photorhabdus kleinii]|uniref:hemagglutinin repeat-containing protein n=1 Tax=Photorhabdus kleinii TaxID=768034 RepID=UPI0021D49D60